MVIENKRHYFIEHIMLEMAARSWRIILRVLYILEAC